MKPSNPITTSCLVLGPTFLEPSGLVLSPIVGFFGKLLTQIEVWHAFNIHSFRYHANTSLLMHKSKGKCLVISLFHLTYILFIFSPFFYSVLHTVLVYHILQLPIFYGVNVIIPLTI
jgi:hypothetical protein